MPFKEAKCPSCGGELRLQSSSAVVTCGYCGKDIVHEPVHAGGPNLANLLELADAASAAGNQDEAYHYYTRVLEIDPTHCDAWLGKAVSAGWSSTLGRNRFGELVAGVERALQLARSDNRNDIAQRSVDALVAVSSSYFDISHAHLIEYVAIEEAWDDHVDLCFEVFFALELACDIDAADQRPLLRGIEVATHLLGGVTYLDPYDTTSDGAPIRKAHRLMPTSEAQVRAKLEQFERKVRAIDPSYERPLPPPQIPRGVSFKTVAGIAFAIVFVLWLMSR